MDIWDIEQEDFWELGEDRNLNTIAATASDYMQARET